MLQKSRGLGAEVPKSIDVRQINPSATIECCCACAGALEHALNQMRMFLQNVLGCLIASRLRSAHLAKLRLRKVELKAMAQRPSQYSVSAEADATELS